MTSVKELLETKMWSKGLSGLLGSKTPSAIRKVLLSTKVRETRRKEMIDKFLRVILNSSNRRISEANGQNRNETLIFLSGLL